MSVCLKCVCVCPYVRMSVCPSQQFQSKLFRMQCKARVCPALQSVSQSMSTISCQVRKERQCEESAAIHVMQTARTVHSDV